MSLTYSYAAKVIQRGSASVEFALVAPLLITILVVIFDFGRIFLFDMAITHAARVGAEYGATNNATCSESEEISIQDIVIKEAQHNGIKVDPDQVEVEQDCTCLYGSVESPTNCGNTCPVDIPKLIYSNVTLTATFNTVLQGAVTSLLNLQPIEIIRSARMRCSSF